MGQVIPNLLIFSSLCLLSHQFLNDGERNSYMNGHKIQFNPEEGDHPTPRQTDLTDETLSTLKEVNLAKMLIGIRTRRSLKSLQNSYFNSYFVLG